MTTNQMETAIPLGAAGAVEARCASVDGGRSLEVVAGGRRLVALLLL